MSENSGEHATVVPLALLLRVHHRLQQILSGQLIQDRVEAIVQNLVSPLESPSSAVTTVFAVQQLPLIVLVDGHGALLNELLELSVNPLAIVSTEPVTCIRHRVISLAKEDAGKEECDKAFNSAVRTAILSLPTTDRM